MCCRLSDKSWDLPRFCDVQTALRQKKKVNAYALLLKIRRSGEARSAMTCFAFDCRLSLVCIPVSTRAEREKNLKTIHPITPVTEIKKPNNAKVLAMRIYRMGSAPRR